MDNTLSVQPVADQGSISSVGTLNNQQPISTPQSSTDSVQSVPQQTLSQLDPQVVNLAKAIRQVESGGNPKAQGKSGEYGAYQWMPSTWLNDSQKYLGQTIPIQQSTLEQQNEVAYKKIADWKAAGYNVGEIASMWNAGGGHPEAYQQDNVGTNSKGVSYNTPAYAEKVAKAYQQIKANNPTYNPQPYSNPDYTATNSNVNQQSNTEPNQQNTTGRSFFDSSNPIINDTNKIESAIFGTVLMPVARLAQSFINLGGAAGQAYDTYKSGSNDYSKAIATLNNPVNTPGLGNVAPYTLKSNPNGKGAAPYFPTAQSLGDVVGGGVQLGSLLAPGAGEAGGELATQGANAIAGAKTGAAVGGAFGVGGGLQDPNTYKNGVVPGVVNVGTQGLIGAAIGAAGGAAASPLLNKGTNALAQEDQGIWNTIMPQEARNSANAEMNTATGKVAVSIPQSSHDLELINTARPYVDPNNPIKSYNNLDNAVEQKSIDLRNSLPPGQGTWSTKNLQGVINDTPVPIGARGELSNSQVNGIKEFVMNLGSQSQKDAGGTLDLSRQYRKGINAAFGENIWNKDTPIANYARAINKSLNKFTASRLVEGNLPNGSAFEDVMKEISNLFEARDNIKLPKAGAQTQTNLMGKLIKGVAKPMLRQIPGAATLAEGINFLSDH